MTQRFMADITLGKLAKWLRIMGYDVRFYRGAADKHFLNEAGRESRIALTRKVVAPRQYSGTLLVISSDSVDGQIAEVIRSLSLKPNPSAFFTICLKCNRGLKRIARRDAEEFVPRYVYESGCSFRSCPECGKIYWQGTHVDHALETLRRRIQTDLP